MLAEFVERALAHGPAPVPLRVRAYGGGSSYRTPLRGWYLRTDRTAAVGEDGSFYVLTAPRSLRARLTGTTPTPSDPPLVLGAGGRDGESVDLDVALERALRAAPDGGTRDA
ncbi:hypothetical protein ACFT5B_05970 [Luteimicrobium sp. NPDC057192]|uniref:hypothetical protein n=1 Tax=Luteimicrobium sp. NPDC057192 TaxID=3346042 RepID=UPI0036344417